MTFEAKLISGREKEFTECAKTMSSKELAARFDISYQSVRTNLRRLGVVAKPSRRRWSKDDLKQFFQDLKDTSNADVSKKYGLKISSIYSLVDKYSGEYGYECKSKMHCIKCIDCHKPFRGVKGTLRCRVCKPKHVLKYTREWVKTNYRDLKPVEVVKPDDDNLTEEELSDIRISTSNALYKFGLTKEDVKQMGARL